MIKETLLLLAMLTAAARSQLITGFTLFDAGADQDIGPLGEVLDISTLPPQLTIRVDVNDPDNTIESVLIDLDNGATERREATVPYFLGGDSDGDANPVFSIQTLGSHVIKATAFQGERVLFERTTRFEVVDSRLVNNGSSSTNVTNDVQAYPIGSEGTVSGELKKWHKITIGFSGRATSERNNVINPFLDLSLDVEFNHPGTGTRYVVPGYYACDGNAANSGAQSGSAYLAHFRPDQVGRWEWNAVFREGPNVAVNKSVGESAAFFDGSWGSFNVTESDKVAPDLRAKGRLQYVGERYLQFSETGEYFLKAGADSPENFLAYADFDNTPNNGNWRKSWAPHLQDYEESDPTWSDGKGKAIIGAINYLASTGANVFSFLPMNIGGDDKNVFPYLTDTEFDRFDCSKTAQWDVVFDHASSKGMFLHFKTQETENDHLLDGGELGTNRMLYYRELIARFGHHLALNWNLGEENTNSVAQRKAYSDYFKEVDPYDHPVVMHTYGGQYNQYEGLLGHPTFDGVSLQANPEDGNRLAQTWLERSKAAGRQWIFAFDEQNPAGDGVVPDSVDPGHDLIRKYTLWGNLMAGGWGVEYYFGYSHPDSDLTCQDFRSRANMWSQSKVALDFFSWLPFWNMTASNEIVGNNNFALFSEDHATAAIYLINGGNDTTIDLSTAMDGIYSVQWYNPKEGGELLTGFISSVTNGPSVSIGNAPHSFEQDWAVLVKCVDCGIEPITPALPPVAPSQPPTVSPIKEGGSSATSYASTIQSLLSLVSLFL